MNLKKYIINKDRIIFNFTKVYFYLKNNLFFELISIKSVSVFN